ATMPAVQMKVVDADDGSPVAGVNVLFVANAHDGTFTGHGGRTANLFAAETLTDPAGQLRIPPQSFRPQPFLFHTNYHNPQMTLLKPGYALVVLTNTLRIIPNLDEVTTWQYDKQTVKMKRATKDAELLQAARTAALQVESAISEKTPCGWKSVPRFIVA